MISDPVSLSLVGLAGVVHSQRQKIKEIKGQAVKVIRNEPNLGWRESQKFQ